MTGRSRRTFPDIYLSRPTSEHDTPQGLPVSTLTDPAWSHPRVYNDRSFYGTVRDLLREL